MTVKNATVLITGANRGIGKAYVEEFLKAGAKRIYLGVRDINSVSDIVAKNPNILIPLTLDVTNQADIDNAVKVAKDVTIIVNNAGVLVLGETFGDDAVKNARYEMEVNYFAPIAIIHAFSSILKTNGGGTIATVASIASHVAFPGLGTYSASKAAVDSIIKSARMELAAQGTQIIGIYPGPIDTDMAKGIDMEKETPNAVALRTIDAIENNIEDVFPDATSQELWNGVKADPKAIEASMQAMYQAAQQEAAA